MSGAGLIEASESAPIYVHQTVQTTVEEKGYICITADSGANILVVNPYATTAAGNDVNAPVYILNRSFSYE